MQPDPWFEAEEIRGRVSRIQAELAEAGLDALLAFLPESVTWSTGFFTRGYSSFQFAIIPADGDPVIVCRDVEAYYLDLTCIFPGRVLWTDSDDTNEVAARAITAAVGQRARLGIEMDAWPLSASCFEALRTGLPEVGWADGSAIISRMRLVKSPAEIAYQRRAASAAEAGMEAGLVAAVAGATEREMAAEICAAMIRAGSDRAGPGVLSSGERALHLHGGYTDRELQHGDTVQLVHYTGYEVSPDVYGFSLGYEFDTLLPDLTIVPGVSLYLDADDDIVDVMQEQTTTRVRVETNYGMGINVRFQWDGDSGMYFYLAPSMARFEIEGRAPIIVDGVSVGRAKIEDDEWYVGGALGIGYNATDAISFEFSFEEYGDADILGLNFRYAF